jgi:fructose 1,6-bisphosphate aldolase/phosphatase
MMRGHGPFMPAILSPDEMEYTSRPEVLKELTKRLEKLD